MKIINLYVKIAGQEEEAEVSCPIRAEADVKSCCLDIRASRESAEAWDADLQDTVFHHLCCL